MISVKLVIVSVSNFIFANSCKVNAVQNPTNFRTFILYWAIHDHHRTQKDMNKCQNKTFEMMISYLQCPAGHLWQLSLKVTSMTHLLVVRIFVIPLDIEPDTVTFP